jgi:hypothetical protein
VDGKIWYAISTGIEKRWGFDDWSWDVILFAMFLLDANKRESVWLWVFVARGPHVLLGEHPSSVGSPNV